MKRPHIVIVCGILHPNPSATGLCAYRYASLLENTCDLEFIALSSNGKEEITQYEGFPVHTLSCPRLNWEHRTTGILNRGIHLLGSFQLKLSKLGSLGWYAQASYNKLEEIHQTNPIDGVLTICSPFSAHLGGKKFKEKHPNIRFCAYTVDIYASKDRIRPFFCTLNDFIKLEKQICKATDCLLLSEEAVNTRQDIYGDIHNKMALPYLLPKCNREPGGYFNDLKIHCVYAGSFYQDLRNPEFMLKAFSTLNEDNFVLHLYSAGCDNLVRTYSSNNTNILSHGYVSQRELKRIYASCDFLFGVGNATNDFLPSKTYEYLSLRRPIVFFNPKGFSNQVLRKYPHSLQLSDDMPIKLAAERLNDFLIQEKGKIIRETELNRIYESNTDSHVRQILLKALQLK